MDVRSEKVSRPWLAFTMGDPAGVGPEVLVRAWSQPEIHRICRGVVIGSAEVLQRAARMFAPDVQVVETTDRLPVEPAPQTMPCMDVVHRDACQVQPGTVDSRGGEAAYEATCEATRLALAGVVGGLVTAPINKAALRAAGHPYPGHTELLAALCGVTDVAMMLYLPPGAHLPGPYGLGVVHVTLHTPFRDVVHQLTIPSVLAKMRLVHQAMCRLMENNQPRIAVAALNPHAGESGLFGDEELRIIEPAVRQAVLEGICAAGPFPADTLMAQAVAGDFDAVVAMYHDQGHIALKLLSLHSAVNITLGLPIVRTSVAHGTAFDIAWQGRAQTSGLVHATQVAAKLARSCA